LCRLRPPATADTARRRRSSEYGLLIHAGLHPASILNHKSIPRGIPSDSLGVDNALVRAVRRCRSYHCDDRLWHFCDVARGAADVRVKPGSGHRCLGPGKASVYEFTAQSKALTVLLELWDGRNWVLPGAGRSCGRKRDVFSLAIAPESLSPPQAGNAGLAPEKAAVGRVWRGGREKDSCRAGPAVGGNLGSRFVMLPAPCACGPRRSRRC
jgi:hypothetical protein